MTIPIPARAWQFKPEQTVHVRGWPFGLTATVICQLDASYSWPHYIVRSDVTGDEWRVSQLHLSRKPISPFR